jgi:hypothetical protein
VRFWIMLGVLFLASNASGQSSANNLWTELKAKRDALPGLHQEFDITRTFKSAQATQGSHSEMVLGP